METRKLSEGKNYKSFKFLGPSSDISSMCVCVIVIFNEIFHAAKKNKPFFELFIIGNLTQTISFIFRRSTFSKIFPLRLLLI